MPEPSSERSGLFDSPTNLPIYLLVAAFVAAIYLGCILSPPSLMDDVDAVQAQIARNMITSGDWVSARLDRVLYLEKAPLTYWLIAGAFKIFGPFDWAARIPIALSGVALALLTTAMGDWAFGKRVGLYAGLCISTCIGLFLFTRILIPDVTLTFCVALAIWSFIRALEQGEVHSRRWAYLLAASIGVGLLLKSLIGAVFPIATGLLYLAITGQLFARRTWKRLRPFSAIVIILLIAAPWHMLATLRNPPYFEFTMRSAPGEYHGFFWFYFINEQLLRFLNMRYPRDYNTVPRLLFWLLHLAWLFPFSVYLPAVFRLSYKPVDRAGKMRLLTLCWAASVLVFFTFSTTQEYYSMPCYPALALLIGCGMAGGGRLVRGGTVVLTIVSSVCAAACLAILFLVRSVPTPGDISQALSSHPGAYTLSLGHMQDLTLDSFAYLRLPLALAAVAFLLGALGTIRATNLRAFLFTGAMMVVFFQAARLAMVAFDPYLSSRPLAERLNASPAGELIVDHHYYEFSSMFFYTNRTAWLLNGRFNNLVYGSYAPGAPNIFLTDGEFSQRWSLPQREYFVAELKGIQRVAKLVNAKAINVVAESGGKLLVSNQPLPGSTLFGK